MAYLPIRALSLSVKFFLLNLMFFDVFSVPDFDQISLHLPPLPPPPLP